MNEYLKRCIELAVEINDIEDIGYEGIWLKIAPHASMVTFTKVSDNDKMAWSYDYTFEGDPFYTQGNITLIELKNKLEEIKKTHKGDK